MFEQEINVELSNKRKEDDEFKKKLLDIFEKEEITKGDGLPYTIYTPYANKWREKLKSQDYGSIPTEQYFDQLFSVTSAQKMLSFEDLGFKENEKIQFPSRLIPNEILKNYHETRDLPYIKGTSKLSIHLNLFHCQNQHKLWSPLNQLP